MKRVFLAAVTMLLLGALLHAADLTGKWAGQFDFQGTPVPVTFTLKASGASLTGTLSGLPTDNAPIKDGKIDGATVTFWLVTDYEGSPVKLVFTGKISDNKIDFTMATEDGGFSVDFPVKRSES
jgi:hypothetical protein